jgi:hypothetical protein
MQRKAPALGARAIRQLIEPNEPPNGRPRRAAVLLGSGTIKGLGSLILLILLILVIAALVKYIFFR